jgi:hypothetical protein
MTGIFIRKTNISLTIKILHLGQSSFTGKVRTIFDKVIDLCPNFRYMDTSSTFAWLFTNEQTKRNQQKRNETNRNQRNKNEIKRNQGKQSEINENKTK